MNDCKKGNEKGHGFHHRVTERKKRKREWSGLTSNGRKEEGRTEERKEMESGKDRKQRSKAKGIEREGKDTRKDERIGRTVEARLGLRRVERKKKKF